MRQLEPRVLVHELMNFNALLLEPKGTVVVCMLTKSKLGYVCAFESSCFSLLFGLKTDWC